MNIYGDPADEEWFAGHYKATGQKLNMGKSCVWLKTLNDLPIDLIGEAIARSPGDSYIQIYETAKGIN